MTKTINIAKDFSRYPYGRLRKYSETSGECFREDILLPIINDYDQIIIELDGTEGYGSSFLDEAFAGLIAANGFAKEIIIKKFKFVSVEDPSLIDEIMSYIDQAQQP